MPFLGKKTTVFKSRGHLLLSLVPKPRIDSDDELFDGDDVLDWDENQLEAGIQNLFKDIGQVDFDATTENNDRDSILQEASSEQKQSEPSCIDQSAERSGPSTVTLGRGSRRKNPTKIVNNVSKVNKRRNFFSEECIELIVHQTNLYSLQQTGTSLNVDRNAIKAFIGIQLLMGIVDLPAITSYWSQRFRQQSIVGVMSLKKLLKIRRLIHFANNEEQDDDPFFKIRPIAEIIRRNCTRIPAEKKYSVDEMMVPYKGSKAGSKKQYMPKKPCKWGFKFFVRSGISGIVYDFLPYCGSSSFRGIEFTPKEETMPFSAQVVLALCKSIPDPTLSTIFFDNFFSSLGLMIHLREELGILSLGTVRANRTQGAPLTSEKEALKRKRGWYEEFSDNSKKVALVQWVDSKPVLLASTYVSVDPVEKIDRWSKTDRAKVEVDCPQIVKECNKHMGGVDLSDMLIALYRTPLRSHRWYLPLFAQLLDICVNNAWLLYRRDFEEKTEKKGDEEESDTEESSDNVKTKNTSSTACHRQLPLKDVKGCTLWGSEEGFGWLYQGESNKCGNLEHDGTKKKRGRGGRSNRSSGYKEFRADVAEMLIRSSQKNSKKRGAARSLFLRTDQPRRNNTSEDSPATRGSEDGNHFPSFSTKGKCRFCHKNQTIFYCSSCDKRLCLVPRRNCFTSYHESL